MATERETPQEEPSVPDLLTQYAQARERRRVVRLATLSGLMILIMVGSFAEVSMYGTSRIFAVEAAIVAVALVLGLAFGYSGLLFWLAWSFAEHTIRRGATRWNPVHLIGIMGLSALACLPFAAMALHEDQNPLRALILFAFLFWVKGSATMLGYCAKFWSMRRSDESEDLRL